MPASLGLQAGVLALLADRDWPIHGSKRFIQQFVPRLSQKDKQFGFANPLHNLLFLLAQLHRGVPDPWLHALPPESFFC
jgi:hypothetical protein